MPAGTSAGWKNSFPAKSALITSSMPIKPLSGRMSRCSTPASLREIWGAIKPTNAMLPATETQALMIATHAMSRIVFSLFDEIPRLLTVSSSKRIVSSKRDLAIRIGINTSIQGRTAVIYVQLADQMLPFFHTMAI